MPACGEVQFPDSTLYRVGGHIETLKLWTHVFANDVIQRATTCSGDDEYFDYFPAYIEMFLGVCVELDMHELFDKTIKMVKFYVYGKNDENYEDQCPEWFELK